MNNQHYRARRSSRLPLWIGIAVLIVLLAIVLISVLGRHKNQSTAALGGYAPKTVVADLTEIPSSIWRSVGLKGAVSGQITTGHKQATFLYVGALGCPFCAAERWPMIVALSRFGHFSGLTLNRSSGQDSYPNTPTFSFLKASYHSPYIHADLMEILGRKLSPTRGFYPPLMKLTPAESKDFATYDGPPYVPQDYAESFPFVLVGTHYVWIGSSINPALLDGKSWRAIAKAIRTDHGALAHDVLANANALTSAICAVDGRQPQSICEKVSATVPAKAPS